MNVNAIVLVSLAALAGWYYLYLLRKGASLLTNLGPLFHTLEGKYEKAKTEAEAERIRNTYLAARKAGRAALIYLLLGTAGIVGLAYLITQIPW